MEKELVMEKKKQIPWVLTAMMGIGAAIGLWAVVALMVGLGRADWQVSEMFRQYLVAVGVIREFETLVDFYTHIKGIEYILAVGFLSTFPLFYKYVSRTKATISE